MSNSFFPEEQPGNYINVILPIAIPKAYTYLVPAALESSPLRPGMRVEVPFGKTKIYAAMVTEVHDRAPEVYKAKPILSVIDEEPIVFPMQLKLWEWMATYYACSLGEVMNAALPNGFKLSSETILMLSPVYDDNYTGLKDKEFMIAEALYHQKELTIGDVRKILGQKSVGNVIKRLLENRVIYIKEELKEKYAPKKVICIRFQEPYVSNPEKLEDAFELLSRSTRQVEALMAMIQLNREQKFVKRIDLVKAASTDVSVITALEKKKIIEKYEREVSRLGAYEDVVVDSQPLTDQQVRALKELKECFTEKNVALLFGVTGSGKTRVYMELIQEAIDRGEQILYLLPEIALTTQLVGRLQRIFGDAVTVFHSRLSNNERVEMWNSVHAGKSIVMGARSSLFMPFNNLRLIIVDEEHDPSFKQNEPAPRYNARDTAIFYGHISGAKVILGTATPSLETYFNAHQKKYGLVMMEERFGGIEMPQIEIVDMRTETLAGTKRSHFSSVLLKELEEALGRDEQAILFQNRRGYSPTVMCGTCGWSSECINCDVTLTYHKFSHNLRCHYCSYNTTIPRACPACGETPLTERGFGTEKIEDELQIYLPDAKIARMDFDTVKGKNAFAKLINDFEEKRIDVLVGTQMVTKGLDFDNVGLVGVLSADQLVQFPDFRSSERAFQLITQVSGRAGRKRKQGKVVIQAFNTALPILDEIFHYDYPRFFEREIEERHLFMYPPYSRLIGITLKYKKMDLLNEATKVFARVVKSKLGERVLGPTIPGVSRIRGQYLLTMLIKLERNNELIHGAKRVIAEATEIMKSEKGFSGVRVIVDVDPV
ncbi:MAG: primosomal protein N' (replication factor Y) [Polaribacter sp.]